MSGTAVASKQVWYGREIYLNDIYLVFFPDERAALTDEQRARIKTREELRGLADDRPEDSPYVRMMTGRDMINYAALAKRIPLFDMFFDDKAYRRNEEVILHYNLGNKVPELGRRRVTLLDHQGYQFYMQYSKKFKG